MSGERRESCVSIVKQGYLFIKRPPKNGLIRLKSWHKRYFVLRDETIDHPSRLEMYQKEADFAKNQVRFILNLDKVIHVGRAEDSKRFRQAFMVVCAGRSPILMAEEDAMYTNSWLLAVTLIAEKRNDDVGCESGGGGGNLSHYHSYRSQFLRPDCGRSLSGDSNDCFDAVSPLNFNDHFFDDGYARKYEISIESTSTSRRSGIEGDYVLTIRSWGLSLSKPKCDDYVVNWPLGFIRKFKSESLPHSIYRKRLYVVTLELGRRSATGEGIFQFQTVYGKEIIADMNMAISRSMSFNRCLTRSRPSLHGSSQSYCNFNWRSSSKDSNSSLTLSRQSSAGNTSHSTELNVYQNGVDGLHHPHLRSPLRSDSSGDSKVLEVGSAGLKTSLTSLTSSSSSPSSSSNSSALSSSSRKSSCESGQYVETEINSYESRRTSYTSQTTRPRSNTDCSQPQEEAQRTEEPVIGTDERAAKAAAEGYLEVLPESFSVSKEGEKCSQDDTMNIYHVMDFSKPTSTSPLCHLPSVHHSSLGVNGRPDGGDSKRLRSPRSSYTDLDLFPDINSAGGSMARLRKSSGGRSVAPLGKPPAPLPRPEHTMLLPLPK